MTYAEPTMQFPSMPVELESARAKLVYLYLSMRDVATMQDVADDLDMQMIALCSILRTLERQGLIERDGPHIVHRPA